MTFRSSVLAFAIALLSGSLGATVRPYSGRLWCSIRTRWWRTRTRCADGTVLANEVFSTDHAKLPTGDAHWAKSTKQWFVMIKDEKLRFS